MLSLGDWGLLKHLNMKKIKYESAMIGFITGVIGLVLTILFILFTQ
jgi:hypothetical protein